MTDLAAKRQALLREIAFVLDTPAFFSAEAPALAFGQAPGTFHPRLPDSPSFLAAPQIQCFDDAACRAWRAELDSRYSPEALALAVEPAIDALETGRLGILFERLVLALLRLTCGEGNIVSGIAVRSDQSRVQGRGPGITTWGEFDALVRRQEGAVEHWEMAVKFYLQIRPTPAWKDCVGPGLRDSLDLKGSKTFLQQLPLSTTLLGRAAIESVFAGAPLRHVAFTKGTVFYRCVPGDLLPTEAWRQGACPEGLAPAHAKSWWVAPADVGFLRAAWPQARLCSLPRLRWMAGLPAQEAENESQSWDEFLGSLRPRLKALEERGECLLVALHDPTTYDELTRGFIVTDFFVETVRRERP